MFEFKIKFPLVITLIASFAFYPSQAQNIISLDFGVTSNTPNIVSGGYDFLYNDPSPGDQHGISHGHIVASVMADIFPGAQIMPLKIASSDSLGSTNITNAALNFSHSQPARVVVKTAGSSGGIDQWRAVVDANKIAIVNAGNRAVSHPQGDGLLAPALGGRMIVVGAVDRTGNIAVYSNRAGEVANYYITAPGFNQFTSVRGTSFAAPRVAAVAAQILSQNPNLSANQVTEIIRNTADDKGAPGVDAIYGHGVLNQARALQPILADDSSSTGGMGAIVVASLVISGAVIYAILKNRKMKNLEKTFITDYYDRGYILNLTRQIDTTKSELDLYHFLFDSNQKSNTFLIHTYNNSHSFVTMTWVNSNPVNAHTYQIDQAKLSEYEDHELTSLSFFHQSDKGNNYQFNINKSIIPTLGSFALLQRQKKFMPEFKYITAFTSPYMGFTDLGIASQTRHKINDQLSLNLVLSANDESNKYGHKSDSTLIEGTYQYKKIGLGVQFGSLRENGSLFGGASGGVLSVDQSNTISLGFSGSYKLNEKFTVVGNYAKGYTTVDDWKESYLHNFSTIRSNAFGFGLVSSGLFQNDDQFGLAYSRPLKVINGQVDLRVPAGRKDFGKPLYYNEERINLNPTASEHIFEAYYTFRPKKDIELKTFFSHRNNPNHNIDANSKNMIGVVLKIRG